MNEVVSPQSKSTQHANRWLSTFAAALARGDAASAAAQFDSECYWRDLIAFTWNIKTSEGRDAIADMLKATLATARPTNWKLDGEATESSGITEAWFTFETAFTHGKGHLRLKGDKCWTLLTTAQELKGFEEKKGPTRPFGTDHGIHPDERTGRN